MAVCVLRLPPLSEQVRTARMVAAAQARRLGLDEETQDEVRLAVGEAAARAVLRHGRAGVDADVVITLEDADGVLSIEVADRVGAAVAAAPESVPAAPTAEDQGTDAPPTDAPGTDDQPFDDPLDEDALALALVEGLADRAEVAIGADGQRIRLVWALSWD